MDVRYIDKIKQWSVLHQEASRVKEKLSDINNQKKELEDDIIEYIEENNLEKVSLNISDGVIKFPKRTIHQSISIKYLKSALAKYNDEKQPIDVDGVCEFLQSNLESKQAIYIKMNAR